VSGAGAQQALNDLIVRRGALARGLQVELLGYRSGRECLEPAGG